MDFHTIKIQIYSFMDTLRNEFFKIDTKYQYCYLLLLGYLLTFEHIKDLLIQENMFYLYFNETVSFASHKNIQIKTLLAKKILMRIHKWVDSKNEHVK